MPLLGAREVLPKFSEATISSGISPILGGETQQKENQIRNSSELNELSVLQLTRLSGLLVVIMWEDVNVFRETWVAGGVGEVSVGRLKTSVAWVGYRGKVTAFH